MNCGAKSTCWPVTSGVLQGLILGPLLLNVLINDLDDRTEGTLSKIADNKLWTAVNILEGRDVVQKGLNRLEKWVDGSIVKFNKSKCTYLQVEWNNIRQRCRLLVDSRR